MDDLISRQAAIDALENDKAALDKIIKGMSAMDVRLDAYVSQRNQVVYDIYAIKQLPPIQPVSCSEFPNNSDTISRQAAIDAMAELQGRASAKGVLIGIHRAWEAIKTLPSAQPDLSSYSDKLWRAAYERGKAEAQPEIIRCKDCKHWIPYDWMFSEVWQSKNIADYPEDEIGCDCCDMAMKANDFCSRAEMKEVTT